MVKKMNKLDYVAITLLIIGGLNWGLVALGYNLVTTLFGIDGLFTKIVYGAVGVSAFYSIYRLVGSKKR
jgi:hypothetical protein